VFCTDGVTLMRSSLERESPDDGAELMFWHFGRREGASRSQPGGGRSRPPVRYRWKRATLLNLVARVVLALTIRGYRRGLLGPRGASHGIALASTVNHVALQRLSRRRSEARQSAHGDIDSTATDAPVRFLVKLILLFTAALVQIGTPWGFGNAGMMLCLASALISLGLALVHHEKPVAPVLNYWDEGLAFVAIGVAAHWLA
jgi:hypothetical protein